MGSVHKNNVSPGKLNFQYKDADLHLKSTSIDWLAISAVSAVPGYRTINGEGLYTFRVKAKYNGEPGGQRSLRHQDLGRHRYRV